MMRGSILAASLVGVSAFKSYIMKNSQVIGGDHHSELLEIDMDSKTERMVNNELTATTDFVKGSAVCGNTWYGIGTQMSGGNVIAQVDITTGELKVTNVGGLWFQIHCGATNNVLYAVTAINSPPEFAVVKLTLGGEYPQTDVVMEFPPVLWGGWPSSFTFSGNELQANFAVQKKGASVAHDGEVYRVDLATGNITMHKQYAKGFLRSSGVPYFVRHIEGGMTSTGVFSDEELQNKMKLCNVDFSGNSAKVSNCKSLTDDWWASGIPSSQECGDGLHYFPSIGGRTDSYQPIDAGNMVTGEVHEAYQFQGRFYGEGAEFYLGTHACVQSPVTV